jgi:hypothetical protein
MMMDKKKIEIKKREENKDSKMIEKKENIKTTDDKQEPISISELKQKYDVQSKNHWPLIIIIFLILCVGIYFGYNYYLNNLASDNSKNIAQEPATGPKVNQTFQEDLTCEEEFAILLPEVFFLTRQTGSAGDWIFNPVDNTFNNYTNGMPLLPQRNLFYTKTAQNKYIAREGINSNDYFKYLSSNLLVLYNPILVDDGKQEEIITIKGIPMSLKEFRIEDLQITKCINT